MKRGIFYSIDALIALTIAMIMVLGAYTMLDSSPKSTYEEQNLYHISSDSLTALKYNDVLGTTIKYDSTTQLQIFVDDMLPENVCARIKIVTKTQQHLYNVLKDGCNDEEDVLRSETMFIHDSNIYSSQMEAWYE